MNATKWLTLTEFVKHLGKEGKCRVDETPKGWFISLIQADPMAELSAERRVKRDRHVAGPGRVKHMCIPARDSQVNGRIDENDAGLIGKERRQRIRWRLCGGECDAGRSGRRRSGTLGRCRRRSSGRRSLGMRRRKPSTTSVCWSGRCVGNTVCLQPKLMALHAAAAMALGSTCRTGLLDNCNAYAPLPSMVDSRLHVWNQLCCFAHSGG